jgi:hypothetical protein
MRNEENGKINKQHQVPLTLIQTPLSHNPISEKLGQNGISYHNEIIELPDVAAFFCYETAILQKILRKWLVHDKIYLMMRCSFNCHTHKNSTQNFVIFLSAFR